MGLNPTSSSITLRRDLSILAQDFMAEEARRWGFIGLAVAPLFTVAEEEGTYPVLGRKNFLKRHATKRGADGAYNRVSRDFGSRSYACEEHGLEDLLDDRKSRKYATWFNYEQAAQRMLLHSILLEQEARIATLVQATGSVNAASAKWSVAGTDAIKDVNTGVEAIMAGTGVPRELISLVIAGPDYYNLCRNTAILAQVASTYSLGAGIRPAVLKQEQIATILGLASVVVAGSAADTTAEGETASIAALWTAGTAQLAVLAAPGSSLESPAAWRTMLWTADSPVNPVVETYRDDSRRGTVLRVRHDVDEVATAEANLLQYRLNIDP